MFGIATFGGLGLGSNMAFRRAACAGKRIFDERLGRGAPFEIAEENYAFAFLLSKGYTVVYLPDAIVFHPPQIPPTSSKRRATRLRFPCCCFRVPGQRLDLLRFLIAATAQAAILAARYARPRRDHHQWMARTDRSKL